MTRGTLGFGRAPGLAIEVTQEIIDQATERNSSHCVVADAVRANLEAKHPGRFTRVLVDLQTIRFSDRVKNERYTYLSPRSCQVCLVNFDQGTKPEPFSFRLRGGQTSRAGLSMIERAKNRTDLQKRRDKQKDSEKELVMEIKRSKATTMRTENTGMVPEKVGGKPPPVSIGLRRQFGLRSVR